jgi:Protein of unknown function (DUF2628)
MAVYTVHEPPMKADQSQPDPERFVFVRDGFSFWAFLLPPLWMLRYRLWLMFLGYVVVATALQVALNLIGASATVMLATGALLSLLIGFEAATLRRFTLARRRWTNIGIVVANDLESAERRFYDAWAANDRTTGASLHRPPRAAASASAVPAFQRPQASSASDVIGLFPEPGASR